MRRRSVVVAAAVALAGCLGDDGSASVDARGDIEVMVDGDPVDLGADRFQAEHAEGSSPAFHLHEGDEHWYMEGDRRVTLAEAIDLLPRFGYTSTDDGIAITVDGVTYHTGQPGTSLTCYVDGERVDPMAHRLADGESIRIELSTSADSEGNQ